MVSLNLAHSVVNSAAKNCQLIVRFSIIFLTGQIAKNRTVRSKTGHLATVICIIVHLTLSAAPDALPSVIEFSRSPLHVSGTVCHFRTFRTPVIVQCRYAQDEVNHYQEESEQNEVDGMKKEADSTR